MKDQKKSAKKVAIDHEMINQSLETLEFILAASEDDELVSPGLRHILKGVYRDIKRAI